MTSNWRQPYGLRPTLRQLMIVVVHFALLFSLAAPILRGAPPAVTASLVLPLSPPLMALLILVFDRPGPTKFWLMVAAWLIGRGNPGWFLLVPSVLGFASLIGVARRLPRKCPECGRRSLLPLGGGPGGCGGVRHAA